MFKSFRFRFMAIVAIVALAALVISAPGMGIIQLDYGADAVRRVSQLLLGLIGVCILHISRKGLHDYIDASALVEKAKESPVGAGLVFIGYSITLVGIAIMYGLIVLAF